MEFECLNVIMLSANKTYNVFIQYATGKEYCFLEFYVFFQFFRCGCYD